MINPSHRIGARHWPRPRVIRVIRAIQVIEPFLSCTHAISIDPPCTHGTAIRTVSRAIRAIGIIRAHRTMVRNVLEQAVGSVRGYQGHSRLIRVNRVMEHAWFGRSTRARPYIYIYMRVIGAMRMIGALIYTYSRYKHISIIIVQYVFIDISHT